MSFFSQIFGKGSQLDLTGTTDWHCHILPGVDDGMQTMEDSIAILTKYEEAGIKEVWLTPHIMEDIPNTTTFLRQRYSELKEAYQGPIKLNLAAENMIDNLFMERLETNDLLPIGKENNTLLVETSYFNSPLHFYNKLEAIKSKGYFPLLAHPERYIYIDRFSTYKRLKEMGVRFQLNLMSFSGHYGPTVKEKAIKLLTSGMADRFGSDLHRHEHLAIIREMRLNKKILSEISQIISHS